MQMNSPVRSSRTALILISSIAAAPFGFAAQAAIPAQTTVSSLLQPSLDTLGQAVGAVKVEKWKGGSVRAEAASYVASIQQDLKTTLPPLLADADAASGMTSQAMPVSRNINALYDVVLRVVDGARIAAPVDQVNRLQDAMIGIEKSRKALDERLLAMTVAQEKQIADLQSAAKAQPVITPCPPPPPEPKKKVVRKKKPAAIPAPTNAQPAVAPKPN
jgi:hypothetical protein